MPVKTKPVLKLLCHFAKADFTYFFALERDDIVFVSTENTAGKVLFDNNSVALNSDFNGVVTVDVKSLSHLLGNNKSAKLINASHNTDRFHRFSSRRRMCRQ